MKQNDKDSPAIPPAGRTIGGRTDKIVLLLCLMVLALLAARTMLPKKADRPPAIEPAVARQRVQPRQPARPAIQNTDAAPAPVENAAAEPVLPEPAGHAAGAAPPLNAEDPLAVGNGSSLRVNRNGAGGSKMPAVADADATPAAQMTEPLPEPPVKKSEKITPTPSPARVYSVQIGSFRNRKRADRMVGDARGMGFEAAIIRLKDGGENMWYVVQIGDYTDRRQAALAASRYRQATGSAPSIAPMPSALLAERKIAAEPAASPPAGKSPPAPLPDEPIHLIGQGDYKAAAAAFHRQLRSSADRYTVKLEVDCSEKSVLTAFQQAGFNPRMFILPIDFRGQPCYLVLWGIYDTESQAAASVPLLPAFFRNQTYPPRPVRLGTYLKIP